MHRNIGHYLLCVVWFLAVLCSFKVSDSVSPASLGVSMGGRNAIFRAVNAVHGSSQF